MSSVDVHGLPAKWRGDAQGGVYGNITAQSRADAFRRCASELEAALRQSGGAVDPVLAIQTFARAYMAEVPNAELTVHGIEAGLRAVAAPPATSGLVVDDEMVFRMAVWMALHDGNDDPHYLIWEGSPPEPWGEVWNTYEDDARAALTAVLAAHDAGGGR